ncbi:hypothetical protein NW752_008615 [Fusarium irregulare]|uniref:DUF6546 domain-containing protein n=1 Tax=Fusarium irregulare TaxID=2494466 RepID=A0A9W8PWQ2_9HYPO|nr:hypothetical protein NW752_008615 [Fusarium irregulare]KAJ4020547.1 hypothetical protein NW766_002034 [Fusarium irregulare]
MFPFYSFPVELQTMVLNFIVEDPYPISEFFATPCSLAPYARVNKHWNDFFESKTFRTLSICPNDIKSLATIVTPRRRAYLKHLWLRIPLTSQPCCINLEPDCPEMYTLLNQNFTMSVVALWNVISTWNQQKGMTLELSASSACYSDCFMDNEARLYKEYLSSGQFDQYDEEEDIHERYNYVHNVISECVDFPSNELRDLVWTAIVDRLFGTEPLKFTNGRMLRVGHEWELPRVTAVSKFLIRRQQFHNICPTALNTILSSLEGIEDIHIERWRCPGSSKEKIWCQKAQIPLARELPRSTKSLSLYGETNTVIHQWESKGTNVISFAKALRQYTNFLEHLSISHMVDAREFFRPFSSANEEATSSLREWPNLKTISLTSDVFKTGTEEEINSLLCTAARAARKMPKLQMLQLWNGEAERACVFRYRVEDTVGEITWCGTDIEPLTHGIVKEWNAVSVCLNRKDAREFVVPVKKEDIASTGQVLAYLSNKDQIMHPASAYRVIGKDQDQETGMKATIRHMELLRCH